VAPQLAARGINNDGKDDLVSRYSTAFGMFINSTK